MATYGTDNLDYSNKYGSPYLITLNLAPDGYVSESFKKYIVSYSSKPTGTDIELSYLKNTATPYVAFVLRDKSDEQQMEVHKQVDTGLFQLKMEPTVNGNNAPEINEIMVFYTEKLL